MNSSHMESSNSESLKRRQNFDGEEVELQLEDPGSTSSDGSHKKARYAWQIKGSVSSLSEPPGDSRASNRVFSHCSQGGDFVSEECRILSEASNEHDLHSATDHEHVQMEESGSEENDSRYYEDQSIDLSSDSHQAVAPSSHTLEHQSAVPYRRHSFPILSNRFPNSHHDSHDSVSRNSDLAVWQSKHVAKSIVDNAINKTLEEMGVSPEKEQDEFMADKSELESQGISEAIKIQGLVHPSQHSESRTLSPLLSHLRRASDLVFTQPGSQNLRSQEPGQHHILHRSSDFPRDQSSRSSELTTTRTTHMYHNEPPRIDNQIPSTSNATIPVSVPVSNSEILDHAVSLVISNQGLSLP